jgi:hypothetical protein
MPDLLVNLLNLPTPDSDRQTHAIVRRAQPFEITPIRLFVEHNFSLSWADELSVGFANKPISVFVAIVDGQLVGFFSLRMHKARVLWTNGRSRTGTA